ncbi:c2h2 finger domain containing protein [Ophiostoma piceae UAMH 11346]|uniref:C2h2 finger domain containing protein n=1 Tax=Ophiostoma piceae (strain UAMH 11346) TaxID=1262450 RepID=S3C8W1_OPHP1|nr:c2h2 finger domain containing protein [Ophiostoma piceae UAMH 11346]
MTSVIVPPLSSSHRSEPSSSYLATSSSPHRPRSTIPGIMTSIQELTPPHVKLEDDQHERGRHRSRSGDKDDVNGSGHGDDANSSQSEGPARKRRRSRKGLDKKFECPQKGCGKSYSRAEHLHRHQLNHTPKQIYSCDYPGCERIFVRQDLCNRHRDRHTAKGSSLNRKDTLPTQTSPVRESRPSFGAHPGSPSPESNRPATAYNKQSNGNGFSNGLSNGHTNGHSNGHSNGHAHAPQGMQVSYSPKINTSVNTNTNIPMPYSPMTATPTTAYTNGYTTSTIGTDYMSHDADNVTPVYGQPSSSRQRQQVQPYQSPAITQRPLVRTNDLYDVMSPTIPQTGFQNQNTVGTPQSTVFVSTQNFPNFDLPPSNFVPPATQVGPTTVSQEESATAAAASASTPLSTAMGYVPGSSHDFDAPASAGSEMMVLDQMSMPNTMPMFGTDSIMQKSPHVGLPEDFMVYLFNSTPQEGSPLQVGYGSYGDFQAQYGATYPGNDPGQGGYFPAAPQQVMSVTNLLDQDFPESYVLTEEKSSELFDMIKDRFHEDGHTPVSRRNDSITDGNRNDDAHMLSRRMMEAYIGSYWMHFSDQIPILHKPTFSPDRAPNLLLLAMMTIGAACLDKTHEIEIIKAGAELSNFLAWHLRWELFMHANFRPPAKLWVFQTLLLLELYEKMYSTRELHERAHIHHATTITLMRRGRSLIGRTAADSPPSSRMNGSDRDNSSRHSSTSGAVHTQDHWWNNWITNEATRRTAFAAFVIDSIHATMFGHSTVMVAHEMRLPLPCDDKLWKASSGADVGRAEAQLQSEGTKSISFLEGIKKTLSGHEVKTNAFGRTILMAGLLSVSWHMNQRDLQVNSLGGSQALGGRDKWRSTLTRAFDSWKSDYDKSLQRRDSSGNLIDPYAYNSMSNEKNNVNVVFESRVVLHHLAHMATHVDIVDLQIYARAKRLLGRAIGNNDLASAQRRMKDVWAPTAKARDATYYAMQFLCSVLLRNEGNSPQANGFGYGKQMGSGTVYEEAMTYSARDDVLLNRPWVLYFAALVVWSYGYATEGPAANTKLPTTWEDKVQQMREYLHQFGNITSPEELKAMKGINNNSAMLMVLKVTFSRARWQLLHEGANLLDNCIMLNIGEMH